jgi:hypothetical protein
VLRFYRVCGRRMAFCISCIAEWLITVLLEWLVTVLLVLQIYIGNDDDDNSLQFSSVYLLTRWFSNKNIKFLASTNSQQKITPHKIK